MLLSVFPRLAWRAARGFLEHNCPFMAAAISYYVFLSLFPLVLAVVAVAGFVFASETLQADLIARVTGLLPESGDFLHRTVAGIISAREEASIIAFLGLLVGGLGVFTAIRTSLNVVWGVEQPRPFLRQRLMDLAMLGVTGVLLLASVTLSAFLELARQTPIRVGRGIILFGDPGEGAFLPQGWLWQALDTAIPFLLAFSNFLLLYYFVPHALSRVREIWPGALVATLGFEATKGLFFLYLRSFASYNLVYGSLSAVAVLLLGAYVSALVMLLGAEVAAAYPRVMAEEEETRARPTQPGPALTETPQRNVIERPEENQRGNGES